MRIHEQINERLSHELLLLLSRLGNEDDERAVVEGFREGVNSLQERFLLGKFTDRCEGPHLEVCSPGTRFGAYPVRVRGDHRNTEELSDLRAAAELLALILESSTERRRCFEPGVHSERDLEAAVHELRAENRNLLDMLDVVGEPMYLWEMDASGSLRCVESNAAAEKMLGYESDEFLDAPPSMLVSAGSPSVSDYLGELRLNGYLLFETTHYTRDDIPVPVEVAAQLSRAEGREVVVTTVRNIRARNARRVAGG